MKRDPWLLIALLLTAMLIWFLNGCGMVVYSGGEETQAESPEVVRLKEQVIELVNTRDLYEIRWQTAREDLILSQQQNESLLSRNQDLVNEKEKVIEELIRKLDIEGLSISFNVTKGWEVELREEETEETDKGDTQETTPSRGQTQKQEEAK